MLLLQWLLVLLLLLLLTCCCCCHGRYCRRCCYRLCTCCLFCHGCFRCTAASATAAASVAGGAACNNNMSVTIYSSVKIGFEIRKKSFQAGNCFILFFKWSLITINFWAPKNHGGMCRNFEKRVEKNRFLQISFLEFVLQKIFKTYELILIKFCTKHFK